MRRRRARSGLCGTRVWGFGGFDSQGRFPARRNGSVLAHWRRPRAFCLREGAIANFELKHLADGSRNYEYQAKKSLQVGCGNSPIPDTPALLHGCGPICIVVASLSPHLTSAAARLSLDYACHLGAQVEKSDK